MLCDSVVSVVAGIVVLMSEDVDVVFIVVAVFRTVEELDVNATVDELLGLSVVDKCAVVSVVVIIVDTAGSVGDKNTEIIKSHQMYHYNMQKLDNIFLSISSS